MKSNLLNQAFNDNATLIKTAKLIGSVLLLLFFMNVNVIQAQGTWTAVATAAPNPNSGVMILLSDGSVICKTSAGGASYGNTWNKLTPNSSGSYINGTWSTIAPMIDTRLYFSSQVLKDGRVYVAGGEYGTGLLKGEVYNPIANTWTATPNQTQNISDANSEILPDGRVLQALVAGNLRITTIYNPATNTYTAGPQSLGIHNESAWVKLPDNSVLFVDRLATTSERYIPSTNTWVNDGVVPVSLYDSFGLETGGAVLLPDGRAFFLGSTGHTAYYTPSGTNSPGTWAAGPDIPLAKGTPDAPMAMMVNGKILCAVSPVPTSANHFPTPTTFYVFDYLTNTFTSINAPGGAASLNIACYTTNMLDLPDGSVLYSRQGSSQYYVFTPTGSPLAAGKPTIANISQTTCTTFQITGTLFNGISQGASYGDDWQMSTNYPLVRLKSGSNVYYARTANWNRTGVMTGSLADTAQFTLPAGLPTGTYSLVVVANGIASDSVSFTTPSLPTLSSTLTPPAICSNTAFTYTPTSATPGATFTWTRAAVSGISNAAITVPQTTNPSEVLINTTSTAKSVVYAYTITAGGCGSNTQNVTVVVNPTPIVTISGNAAFCAGSSITLNAGNGFASYNWSTGASTQTLNVNTANTFTVTVTNANGCSGSASVSTTVNSVPTTSISGNSVVCNGNVTQWCASGGLSYLWSTGSNTQCIGLSNAGTYTVTATNASGCTSSSSKVLSVNLGPIVSIAGNTVICQGGSNVLNAGTGFLSYLWSNGAVTQTISVSTAGIYTVTVSDFNGCTGSGSVTTTSVLNPMPFITGNTSFCTGSSTTLNAGSGFNSYSWSSGATTQTISVNNSGTFTVSVTDANGCSGNNSVYVNPLPNPIPNITGMTSFCAGSTSTLSSDLVWSSYNWSTGASTQSIVVGNASTFSITVTDVMGCTGTASVVTTIIPLPIVSFSGLASSYLVNDQPALLSGSPFGGTFSGPGISGITFTPSVAGVGGPYTILYSYTDVTGCSNSTSQPTTVVNCPTPATPGTISTIGGAAKVCPGDSKSYKIIAVSGATSYTWTPPTGGTITSGQGTIQVTINYNAGFVASDSIKVVSNNACGSSAERKLKITRNNPATPSVITGLGAGVCNSSGVPYSVTNVSGITYSWSFNTANATVATGQGSNSVTANYSPAYSTGSLSVTANNGCGVSTPRSITTKSAPATPASVTGATSVCANQFGVPYSISALTGAVDYTWTGPTGSHISDGITTSVGATLITTSNAVTVNYGATAGILKVRGNNSCASGGYKSVTITFVCKDGDNVSIMNPDLSVYPNPNNGIFTIQFTSNENLKTNLSLLNFLGQKVYATDWNLNSGNNTKEFNMMDELPAGIYFVVISSENETFTQKVVKE